MRTDEHGISGPLPLVLNLPVRFADSPNPEAKEQGIRKYTRGICRGWQLEEQEAISETARIDFRQGSSQQSNVSSLQNNDIFIFQYRLCEFNCKIQPF